MTIRIFIFSCLFVLICFSTSTLTTAQAQTNSTSQSSLVDIKCSKCHTLKRIFVMFRPVEEWRTIVQEMMNKNPQWIRQEEIQMIINEIVKISPERIQATITEKKNYEDARFLFVDRCSICHSINRVLIKNKMAEEWQETVERMRSEAYEYIKKEDAERITHFLIERIDLLREDAGGRIFVAKCLICHPGEQILLETHDRPGWEKIVEKMQTISRDTLLQVRLNHEEVKLVVELLVKTQGAQ